MMLATTAAVVYRLFTGLFFTVYVSPFQLKNWIWIKLATTNRNWNDRMEFYWLL